MNPTEKEPQELVDLCMNCDRDDCTGNKPCLDYRILKAQLTGKQPNKRAVKAKAAPPKEEPGIMLAEIMDKDKLSKLNTVIAALEELLHIMPSAAWTPAILQAPRDLRRVRMEAYERIVDWQGIAEKMEGENGTDH